MVGDVCTDVPEIFNVMLMSFKSLTFLLDELFGYFTPSSLHTFFTSGSITTLINLYASGLDNFDWVFIFFVVLWFDGAKLQKIFDRKKYFHNFFAFLLKNFSNIDKYKK